MTRKQISDEEIRLILFSGSDDSGSEDECNDPININDDAMIQFVAGTFSLCSSNNCIHDEDVP